MAVSVICFQRWNVEIFVKFARTIKKDQMKEKTCIRKMKAAKKQIFAIAMIMAAVGAAHADKRITMPETWVAVDGLRRGVVSADSGASLRKPSDNYQVGMFYYIWHGQHGGETKDNTKLLAENPENPKFGPFDTFHWGGEPALGYYKGGDPFVIAKHMQWLVDAGVDFYFLDVTNGYIYPEQVKAVMREIDRRRSLGLKTPKLVFTISSNPVKTIKLVYETFYTNHDYDKYWYEWQGKPLVFADMATFPELSEDIINRFTWRHSWAWMEGKQKDKWAWLETYPQKPGWTTDGAGNKVVEQICVTTAEHPIRNMGKSYHDSAQPPVDKYGLCKETPYGLYFQEQMRQALKVHAPVLMVTQWNEWMAQRFRTGNTGMIRPGGYKPTPDETYFIDVYNQEFNRDIEPSKEPLIRDNYYMLLCSEMRKYRGVSPIPEPAAPRTIRINGSFDQWRDVKPEFADEPGDAFYTSQTAQSSASLLRATNDIVLAKVAANKRKMYFYVKTAGDIVVANDSTLWLTLLVNADCNYATGWNGYDFMVTPGAKGRMMLKRYANGKWTDVKALKWKCGEKEMMVEMSCQLLGIQDFGDVDFKWIDNVPKSLDDIMLFYSDGDAAPDTRFNYRYKGSVLNRQH